MGAPKRAGPPIGGVSGLPRFGPAFSTLFGVEKMPASLLVMSLLPLSS